MSPRFRRNCLLVGIAGLAACAAGAAANPAAFFRAYLVAYLFWLGIALGCMAIVLIHYLTGGAWGLVIRRVLESGTRTLPLLALAFLPLAFGLRELYEWARPEVVAADALLRHKSTYLNPPFFLVRAAIYLAAWIAVAAVLRRWSPEDAAPPRRLRVLAGPGLAVYGLTMTFAAIDWVMSLEPHWFSTVYGMMFATGQVLAGFAFVIAVTTLLARRAPLAGLVAPNHFTDLGNLLLAFVMLWAYLAFAQYLLIWAGNLPEEIPWYLRRQQGGWAAVAVALILFHFAVPFALLLSRAVKRHALLFVAAGILCMRYVDLFWLVVPDLEPHGLSLHWMDVAAPVGLGGVWLATFGWQLDRRPLLPLHDPLLHEALGHGHD